MKKPDHRPDPYAPCAECGHLPNGPTTFAGQTVSWRKDDEGEDYVYTPTRCPVTFAPRAAR